MSQVQLTLRPAPKADFVRGYPGLPPSGLDRPQAAVEGAIVVKTGPQGVKAKSVHIELRKVETLPGGGMANTFYDVVGPGPVNLWASSNQGEVLLTQDFTFSIPIPESIPPTIKLDDRAGIQYELVASLCTKGKKGFLRKRKSAIVSTQATITINKHELHSTWPVYNQPENRQVVQDGCTLVVERNQTCYGPGDRISVIALFKSNTLTHSKLRGLELSLRESTIFRAKPQSGEKSAPPQVRVVTISESKLPINVPLYASVEQRAELTCSVPPDHTATSLSSARYIDVTYVLRIKATVDQRPPILLDLPVIISNWPRAVSQEVMGRIRAAPTLSLLPIFPAQHLVQRPSWPHHRSPAASIAPLSVDRRGVGSSTFTNAYSTLPASSYASLAAEAGELGRYDYSMKAPHTHSDSTPSKNRVEEFGAPPPEYMTATAVGRIPGYAKAPTATRVTVTNDQPPKIPKRDDWQRIGSALDNSLPVSTQGPWPSAGGAKQPPYGAVEMEVEALPQGSVATAKTSPSPVSTTATHSATLPRNGPWSTAEEQKLHLSNEVRAAVQKTEGLQSYSPLASLYENGSDEGPADILFSRRTPTDVKKPNKAAELYSQAMAEHNLAMAELQSLGASPQRSQPKIPIPQYHTAEQEKDALKRYQEAKRAVDRAQNAGRQAAEGMGRLWTFAPNEYGDLDDDTRATPSPSSSVPSTASDLSVLFNMSANLTPPSHPSEKERLRRAYEGQDAAALAQQQKKNNSPPPFYQHAPTPADAPVNVTQGLLENVTLHRKFEAQDTKTPNASISPTTPPQAPRRASVNLPVLRLSPPGGRRPRPLPVPPISSGKTLTAADEKALLKVRYTALDVGAAMQHREEQQVPENVPLSHYPIAGQEEKESKALHPAGAIPPDKTSTHRRSDAPSEIGVEVLKQNDSSDDTSAYLRSHVRNETGVHKSAPAGETSPHWHSVKYITAAQAYAHVTSKEFQIRDALARLGYEGAYSLHAGFNEEVARLGQRQEEIYVVLESAVSDDVRQVFENILTPFPGIVYTPQRTHFISTPSPNLQSITEMLNIGSDKASGNRLAIESTTVSSGSKGQVGSGGGSAGEGKRKEPGREREAGRNEGDDDKDEANDDGGNGGGSGSGGGGGGDGGDPGGGRDGKESDDNDSLRLISIPFRSTLAIRPRKDSLPSASNKFTTTSCVDITVNENRKADSPPPESKWSGPWFGVNVTKLNISTRNISSDLSSYTLSLSQICISASSYPTSVIQCSPDITHAEEDTAKAKGERNTTGGGFLTIAMNPSVRLGGTMSRTEGVEETQRRWDIIVHELDASDAAAGVDEYKGVLWQYTHNRSGGVFKGVAAESFKPKPSAVFGFDKAPDHSMPLLEVAVVVCWSWNGIRDDCSTFRLPFTKKKERTGKGLPAFLNLLHHVSMVVDLGKTGPGKSWVLNADTANALTVKELEAAQGPISLEQLSRIAKTPTSEGSQADTSNMLRSDCEVLIRPAVHGRVEALTEGERAGAVLLLPISGSGAASSLPLIFPTPPPSPQPPSNPPSGP